MATKLNAAKVLAVGATAEPVTITGGWGTTEVDDKAHYFRITGQVPGATAPEGNGGQPEQVTVASLCGTYEGEGAAADLAECDPLAPENCRECRTALLKYRGMI